MKRIILSALAFYIIFGFRGPLTAQVTTATVYGVVLDSSSAVIVGAQVAIANEATGISVSAATNEAGEFTFTFLPIGRYSLVIRSAGFKSVMEREIDLAAGQRIRRTFSLEVGAATDSVSVTAEAPLVNAVTPEQRETYTKIEVTELPLARRDWSGVLSVSAGARVSGPKVIFNGLAPGAFSFTVDGTRASGSSEDTNLTAFGDFNLIKAVTLEAIAEVHTSKGIASAEIADTLSGNVELITKSGTNAFHGTLFENYLGRTLNARNQFLATRPPEVFNQFGGSVGGPVMKNKLFFFGAYEGYRQRRFATFNTNFATAEFRSQAIAAVPSYKQFFDTQPLPNQPYTAGSIIGRFVGFGSNAANDDHAVVRGDYHLSDHNSFSARYTRGRPDSVTPKAQELNPRTFDGKTEVVTASFTHTRSTLSVQTRFGYNFTDVTRADRFLQLGIPTIDGDLGFSDSGELLASKGTGWSSDNVVAIVRPRHNIKLGGLLYRQDTSRINQTASAVRYANAADMLANIPSTLNLQFGLKRYLITHWNTGFFVQDDFRIHPRLMLNFGLRYEYFAVPRERDARFFNRAEPFGYGPIVPSDQVYGADRNNLSPRLGFAWTMDTSGKTVLRGGAGVFYSRVPIRGVLQLVQNAVDEPYLVTFSRAEALARGVKYPIGDISAWAKVPNLPWTGSTMNPNFPTPYSMQWTLSLQRQIARNLALETSYVGNKGSKLFFTRYMGRVDRVTGLRPVPGFGEFRHFDTSESTHYNGWQTSLRKTVSAGFVMAVHYTWSSNISFLNGDVTTDQDGPQDIDDLKRERGPSNYDIRHRLVGDFVYELPFQRLLSAGSRGRKLLLRGWQVAGIYSAETGTPVNLAMPNAFRNQRIDYVGGQAYLDGSDTTLKFLNPAAFGRVPVVQASGATLRPGTLGRNAIRLPGLWTVDMTLAKALALTERVSVQIRAEMFNALNHTNFGGINSNITQADFGKFTSTRGARTMQLNARLTF